jgi:hypothetical protein
MLNNNNNNNYYYYYYSVFRLIFLLIVGVRKMNRKYTYSY